MKITGSMRELGGNLGAVRVEDRFDSDIDDVWEACTNPERLARWIAEIEGDLRPGGDFKARFTSGWEGTGRVKVCEPPRRLVVITREKSESHDTVIEATLTEDGDQTVLVVEDRGLPVEVLPAHGAGWQVHVEDLGAHLSGGERCDMRARWEELIDSYREAADSAQ